MGERGAEKDDQDQELEMMKSFEYISGPAVTEAET